MKSKQTVVMMGLCACVMVSGCDSGREAILDDDPPSVVALKKAGANVKREANMAAPDMIGRDVDLSTTSMDQELFDYLPDVPGLMTLTLTGSQVSDETLAALPELKTVTRLDLSGSKVTDEGIKHLESFPSVMTVNLTDTQVTGAGLADLPPRVGSLVLANLPIRDEDLENIKHLKGLSMLILTGTQVTPAGVNKLKQGRPFLMTVGIKLN